MGSEQALHCTKALGMPTPAQRLSPNHQQALIQARYGTVFVDMLVCGQRKVLFPYRIRAAHPKIDQVATARKI